MRLTSRCTRSQLRSTNHAFAALILAWFVPLHWPGDRGAGRRRCHNPLLRAVTRKNSGSVSFVNTKARAGLFKQKDHEVKDGNLGNPLNH